MNANTACIYWMHQPKMPEAVEVLMLRKISCAVVRKFELFGLVNTENRDIYLFGVQQFLMLVLNLISMVFIGVLFRQTIQCLFTWHCLFC